MSLRYVDCLWSPPMSPWMSAPSQLRPLLRVGLPVAVAVVFVCLAIINIALVKTWRGEREDGVLWASEAGRRSSPRRSIRRSRRRRGDPARGTCCCGSTARDRQTDRDVLDDRLHAASDGAHADVRPAAGRSSPISVTLRPMPLVRIGPVLLARARRHPRDRRRRVGAAAAAERSGDAAFLLADGRVLRRARRSRRAAATTGSTTSSTGRIWWRGSRCRRCSCTSRSCFPIAPNPWVRTRGRPRGAAAVLRCRRCCSASAASLVMAGAHRRAAVVGLARADRDVVATSIWPRACSAGSRSCCARSTRLRSVTARRQLRWIVWGSSVGALPFVSLYLVPFLFGRVAAVRRVHRRAARLHPARVRLGHRPLPADGHRGHHQEGAGGRGRRRCCSR